MKRRKPQKIGGNATAASLGKGVAAGGRHVAQASSARTILLAAGLLASAALIAYGNSYRCEFIFDDKQDIVENSAIKRLWPIRDVFLVPNDGRPALHGRPVVILSFAPQLRRRRFGTFHLSRRQPIDPRAGRMDAVWHRTPNAPVAEPRRTFCRSRNAAGLLHRANMDCAPLGHRSRHLHRSAPMSR